MPCRPVDLGNGVTAIVCSKGDRRSCKCGRRSTKLCDYPLRGKKQGRTCDAPLCDRCATSVGRDKDYCPAHVEISKREAAEDEAKARELADERDERAARESFRPTANGSVM